MTVLVTALTPEAVVMATDSRLIAKAIKPNEPEYTSTDLATKLYMLRNFNAGFSLTGPILVPDFSLTELINTIENMTFSCLRDMVNYATNEIVSRVKMSFCFHVAGYENNQCILYKVSYHHPALPQITIVENQQTLFMDGNYDIVSIIIKQLQTDGWSINGMTLLDAVNFVALLTQAQVEFSRFKGKLSPVGGPVDVLVITPSRAYFASRKVMRLLSPDVSRFRNTANSPSWAKAGRLIQSNPNQSE